MKIEAPSPNFPSLFIMNRTPDFHNWLLLLFMFSYWRQLHADWEKYWDRVTILLLRKSSCHSQSVLFFKCYQQQQPNCQPKVNKNKLFIFWEIEFENFDFSLCVSSRQHHINSTLRRKKKISRREENPKVDHPGGSSSQSLHRLK